MLQKKCTRHKRKLVELTLLGRHSPMLKPTLLVEMTSKTLTLKK
jgi:hypothetical protein